VSILHGEPPWPFSVEEAKPQAASRKAQVALPDGQALLRDAGMVKLISADGRPD
jgi:hypothetical protein